MKNRKAQLWLVGLIWLLSAPLRADLIDNIDDLDQGKQVADKKPKPAKSPTPSPATGVEKKSVPKEPKAGSGAKVEDDKAPTVAKPPKKTTKSPAKDERKEPVHIKSDGQLTYARSGGVIHMTQNVVITQSDLRFQSDEAKVWVKEGDSENNVEKVECVGNVKVSKYSEDPAEKITGRGQRAFFYNDQRKVGLQGQARLWRGGHLIKGAQITYMLDDGMITVDRAEGVVQPEDKKKNAGATKEPAP